jgi:CheY-like chemotaxis protein
MAEPTRPPYHILCVDDEPAIRAVLPMLLKRLGFAVDTAPDPATALQLLGTEARTFDLIITDNEMPGISGVRLIELVRAQGYDGAIVIFSGSVQSAAIQNFDALRISAVIPKNETDRLVATVRALATARS